LFPILFVSSNILLLLGFGGSTPPGNVGRITVASESASSTTDGGVNRGDDGSSGGSAAGLGGNGGVIVGRSTGPTRSPIPESNGADVSGVTGGGTGAMNGVGIGFEAGGGGGGGGPKDVGNVGRAAPLDVGRGVGPGVTTTTAGDGVDDTGGTGKLVPPANVGSGVVGC